MKSTICSDCNSFTGEQKRHKHIWMYSQFCDTCNCDDFYAWLQEEKEKVILWDLNHLISRMHTENKIDKAALLEILTRTRELARARGYLKLPWEKQPREDCQLS